MGASGEGTGLTSWETVSRFIVPSDVAGLTQGQSFSTLCIPQSIPAWPSLLRRLGQDSWPASSGRQDQSPPDSSVKLEMAKLTHRVDSLGRWQQEGQGAFKSKQGRVQTFAYEIASCFFPRAVKDPLLPHRQGGPKLGLSDTCHQGTQRRKCSGKRGASLPDGTRSG